MKKHEFQGVSDTLFIPLTGRIYVSRRFPEYFYDAKALELEHLLPSTEIEQNSPEYAMIAPAARYYNLDKMTGTFIKKHRECNIVNLGCGLDTAFFRIGDKNAMFYEIDYPDVIEVRRQVLGQKENEILIAADIFTMKWTAVIDRTKPTLLIASGLFQYFYERDVLTFINRVKDFFNQAELIFDATGRIGIKLADFYVRKTGNKSASMHFYIDGGSSFAKKAGVDLIEEKAFFTEARKILKNRLRLVSRISMAIADIFHMSMLIHVRLHKQYDGRG